MQTNLNELQNEPVRVHCPIRGVIEVAPPELEEIAPLVAHLQANQPVSEPVVFPRGTVLEDGRLDLCKQHLGALGCRMITDALADNTAISSLLHPALDTKHDARTDRINALRERNRAQTPDSEMPPARDTTLIRSVYRTAPASVTL